MKAVDDNDDVLVHCSRNSRATTRSPPRPPTSRTTPLTLALLLTLLLLLLQLRRTNAHGRGPRLLRLIPRSKFLLLRLRLDNLPSSPPDGVHHRRLALRPAPARPRCEPRAHGVGRPRAVFLAFVRCRGGLGCDGLPPSRVGVPAVLEGPDVELLWMWVSLVMLGLMLVLGLLPRLLVDALAQPISRVMRMRWDGSPALPQAHTTSHSCIPTDTSTKPHRAPLPPLPPHPHALLEPALSQPALGVDDGHERHAELLHVEVLRCVACEEEH